MHLFGRSSNRSRTGADSGAASTSTSSSSSPAAKPRPKPKLERRNAKKNYNYEYSPSTASSSSHFSSDESMRTRSLDLFDGKTSFRVEGVDGEIEIICKTLGFKGIDDFAINTEEYEAMKVRSISAPVVYSQSIEPLVDRKMKAVPVISRNCEVISNDNVSVVSSNVLVRGNGIKGARPPKMTLPKMESAWDMPRLEQGFCSDEDDESPKRRSGMTMDGNCVLSASCSFTASSNDDDSSSSTTTEPMMSTSPDGRFKRIISEWQKGELLGSGSFGSVYEGIADGGFFFAVKEVSLLDQDDEGKQRILQLEQEIALLSQFEHENIVQYYGTKKDESKLYIFLELVTKGSLLSLYQKYTLRDSQVWSYTRQILHGLKYLHDRNVVHGDIKCANILVDTNGSVKLADFGLAKATKLNDVKSYKGTPFWMAPEVVRSLGYGLPADIWSLGCTVLEMLTGGFQYSNLDSHMAALFRIGTGEILVIPESVSNDARDFILKCLQVDPSLRPTAAELLDHPFVVPPLPPPSTSSGFSNIHLLCGPSPLPPPEKVFGRYFEEKILLSKLLYSDKKETQLSTVPVLGVCGIGKTTLARLVYEDGAVKEHFQLRAWVNVHGPELKLHLAAQGILKCAMGMSCSVDDMDELDEMVRDVLNSNRCLIVFDDIHSMGEDSWLHMNEKWFGFVDLGSRVLITTPNKVVANLVATESPIVLSRLSMDDSLSLLRHLSFGFSESTRDMSESLAQIVASLCQGLPLLLKLVVSQIKFDDNLSNRLSSNDILSTNLNESAVAMMCVLALPPHLREFLAYCSFFAQEYAMGKEKIIRMWSIFDSFVMMSYPTNDARLEEEDIGESYLHQLLNRSFFKDITRDGYGDITDFQVPGLIHKAAQDVADISLVQGRLGVIGSIDGNDGRCLSIVLPSSGEFYSAQRLCVLIFSPIVYPGGRSLDHSLVEFKSLKSLDLSCSGIRDLSDDIGGLSELWYLSLSYTLIESLPESIAQLSELRTLDLSWCFHLKILPKGMGKLKHMRHLDLAMCESLSYLPSGIELLTSLHSMPLFVLGEDRGCAAGLAELGSLNNLRGRLEIRNLENVRKDNEAKDVKLEQKNIQHLGLSWSRNADNCYNVLNGLKPRENLQVLDLTNYMGSIFPKWMEHLHGLIRISINNCGCEVLPSLGQLPYLKDLQLKGMNNLRYINQVFHGDAGGHGHVFPALEKLGLYDIPMLVKWEHFYNFGGTDKSAFPSMKTLSIEGCPKLRECPSLPTLPELIVCDSHFDVLHSSDKLTSLSSLLIKDVDWCVSVYNLSRLRSLKKLILFNIKDTHLKFPHEQDAFVSLEHLGILHCHSLKNLWCPDPTSLQKLHIKDCQNLEVISWSRENHLLFELVVEDCPRLVDYVGISLYLFRSVRKVIIKNCGVFNPYLGDRKLKKLEYLFIGGCPDLERHLKRRPEDISHIPCVILNNRKVKYEDNKHFERKGKLLPTGTSHNYSNSGTGFSADDKPFLSGDILPTPNLKIYTYSDLKSATMNFRADMVLGVGGFGTVYKGWVDEKTLLPSKSSTGIAVAIKKLNHESVQGFGEWLSEVNFLGRLSHPNLVKLLGYCGEDKELLLVHEFMSKGSLENHLFRRVTEPLPWDLRLKISIGAAKGLAFLHTSDMKVILRDFKTSNILLDGDYNAKISNVILAKLGPSGGDSHVTTRVMGTHGYAATGGLYVKSDVYGFGVLLLEMLTGLRAIDARRTDGEENLVDWKKPLLSQRGNLKAIMDARIEGQYSTKAALQTAQLTLKCLEPEPRKRPSMNEVLDVLLQIAAMDKPKDSKSRSSHFSSHRQTTVGAVVGAIIEVEVVIENLLTISKEQISLRIFKDDLETLKKSFSMVHDFLHDAEKIQVNESSVKRWLRDLDARAFDAHNVLAEINYQLVSKKAGATTKKTAKEKVQYFFSNYNPIVYRLRLRRRIQEINEKLESINQQAMGFGLQNIVGKTPIYGSDASASMETNLFSDERSMSQEY